MSPDFLNDRMSQNAASLLPVLPVALPPQILSVRNSRCLDNFSAQTILCAALSFVTQAFWPLEKGHETVMAMTIAIMYKGKIFFI